MTTPARTFVETPSRPARRSRAAKFRRVFRAARALLAAAATAVAGAVAPQAPARADAAGDAIAAATKEYERRLGTTLRVATRGVFVVRGDHEQADLENLAEVSAATFDHYVRTMGCPAAEVVVPARKGDRPTIEVFQFVKEKEYLAFLDKVFARIRDDTVDDRRLALMRRQRGFFVMTPRPIVAQYQGPSVIETVRSQCVHKVSHVLLLGHRRAGAWMPWWLLEGFGAFQELAILKESRTYCIEVDRPGDYALPGTPEADEAAKARLESHWRRRAKELVDSRRQRDLGVLAKLSLNELVLDDVIQSWSVVDWLHRDRKLPAFVTAYKDRREFAATCEAVLGAPPAGVDERWKASVGEAR